MSAAEYHLGDQPIPDGYEIFGERLEVAGLAYHKGDAATFAEQEGQWLELEPEPTNRYDRNAIRVGGCWPGGRGVSRAVLGYVPKNQARAIAEGGFIGEIRPRLLKTYLSESGFVEILFQLLGPKGRKSHYQQALSP